MPFATLNLAVGSASIGTLFSAALLGRQAGARYSIPASPLGFYLINGDVRHRHMPAGVSTFTVRELIPGEGINDTPITITASSRDVLDPLFVAIPTIITAAGSAPIRGTRAGSALSIAINPSYAWSISAGVLIWNSDAVGKANRPIIVETLNTPDGPVAKATRLAFGAGDSVAENAVVPNSLLSPIDGRVLLSPIDGRVLLRAA